MAGTGESGYTSAPVATASKYNQLGSVVSDRAGNRYVADTANCVIRKIDVSGVDSVIVGTTPTPTPQCGWSSDGSKISQVKFLALDPVAEKYLVFSEPYRCLVRRYDFATGKAPVIAGGSGCGYAGDGGDAKTALLRGPQGVAIHTDGVIYVAESSNCDVRSLTPSGPGEPVSYTIRTVVGIGGPGTWGANCTATSGSSLRSGIGKVQGITVDARGRLFVADHSRHVVRLADIPNGRLSIYAGRDKTWGSTNGTRTDSRFYQPTGVAVEPVAQSPTVFVSETGGCRIRRITTTQVTTYAGGSCTTPSGDGGTPSGARFGRLGGVSMSPGGDLLIADQGNHQARIVLGAGPANLSGAAVAEDQQALSAMDGALTHQMRTHGNRGATYEWTQGDGTYSLRLSDGRILWFWGDSLLGNVDPKTNERIDPATVPEKVMLDNQITIEDPRTLTTQNVWLRGEARTNFTVPDHLKSQCSKYWPSAATQVNTSRVQLVLRCVNEKMEVMRVDLANIDITSDHTGWKAHVNELFGFSALFPNHQCPSGTTPHPDRKVQVEFGTSIVPVTVNGTTKTYIYGLGTGCKFDGMDLTAGYVHVASVQGHDLQAPWSYYGIDGSTSTTGPGNRHRASGTSLFHNAGAEYSVVHTPGSPTPYRLVTSDLGMGNILRFVSSNPWGPWAPPAGQSATVWKPAENGAPQYRGAGTAQCRLFAYGGKEQPAFAEAGRFVLSYNVNVAANPNDGDPNKDSPCEASPPLPAPPDPNTALEMIDAVRQNVDNYRPRFIFFTDGT